jgi:hypothetical protein
MRCAAVVALTLVASMSTAAAVGAPARWPPPRCPTAGALVEYHSSNGFTYNDDLVIRANRRASLCWGRQPGARSGRVNFVVAKSVLRRLVTNLRLANCRPARPDPKRPPPPPVPDAPRSSLTYHAPRVPCGGASRPERDRANSRAHAIAASIVDRRVPGR